MMHIKKSFLIFSFSAVSMALLSGCLKPAPDTAVSDLDESCAGTEEGKSCIALSFSATSSLRSESHDWLKGTVYWALYEDGDVNGFGPKGDPFLEGHDADKDVSPEPPAYSVSIPNVPPGKYQILAYIDKNLNGEANKTERVTKPSGGFEAHANKKTIVSVEFNAKKPF
jgi:hypothetical protein